MISNNNAVNNVIVSIVYLVLGGLMIEIVILSLTFDSNIIFAPDIINFSINVEDGIIHINSSIWN